VLLHCFSINSDGVDELSWLQYLGDVELTVVLKATFFLFFRLLDRYHLFTALISTSLDSNLGDDRFVEGSLFVLNGGSHFVSERLSCMHLTDPTLFAGLEPRHDT